MDDAAREALKADLEAACAARDKRRSELAVSLVAIDSLTQRIDVLLLRLAGHPA